MTDIFLIKNINVTLGYALDGMCSQLLLWKCILFSLQADYSNI